MGRKGPRAKTKIVLKSVCKLDQLGSMNNLNFKTFLNKNLPTVHCLVNADSDVDLLGFQESGKGLHICVVLHVHVEVSGDPGEWVRLAGHPGSSSRKKVRSREIFKTYKALSEMC